MQVRLWEAGVGTDTAQGKRWMGGITSSVNMSLRKLQEVVEDREAWRAAPMGVQRVSHGLGNEQQQQRNMGGA